MDYYCYTRYGNVKAADHIIIFIDLSDVSSFRPIQEFGLRAPDLSLLWWVRSGHETTLHIGVYCFAVTTSDVF